jgi:hypothetical protein
MNKSKIISDHYRELQKKSRAAQVKKYGGESGYMKEMSRRNEIRQKGREKLINK